MGQELAISLKDQSSAMQFLTFTLGQDVYGVDILKVREIRGWESIREIPGTPGFIKGVLDLRGSIVPIIDLRMRFDLAAVEYHPTTVIIVLSLDSSGEGQASNMGVVVDSVSDVLSLEGEDIKAAPRLGSHIRTDFIRGMVSREDSMIMLVDSEKLLDSEEFGLLDQLQQDD